MLPVGSAASSPLVRVHVFMASSYERPMSASSHQRFQKIASYHRVGSADGV
jgi:hypothetical protein